MPARPQALLSASAVSLAEEPHCGEHPLQLMLLNGNLFLPGGTGSACGSLEGLPSTRLAPSSLCGAQAPSPSATLQHRTELTLSGQEPAA